MHAKRKPVAICLGILLCTLAFLYAAAAPSIAQEEFEVVGDEPNSPALPVAPQGDDAPPGGAEPLDAGAQESVAPLPGPAATGDDDASLPCVESGAGDIEPEPMASETPMPAEMPEPAGEEPSLTPPEEPLADETPIEVRIGRYAIASAAAGESFSLILPVHCVYGDAIYASNADADGATILYRPEYPPEDYDQTIGEVLRAVSITLLADQQGEHALMPESLPREDMLLAGGVNKGYFVFENLRFAEDAVPGLHSVWIRVAWTDHDGITHDDITSVYVEVISSAQPPADSGEGEISLEPAEDIAEPGNVTLGNFVPPSAAPGDRLTLDIPLLYTRKGQNSLGSTNLAGGNLLQDDGMAGDQNPVSVLPELRVAIAATQPEDFPLEQPALAESRQVILAGGSLGYALFEDLPVHVNAVPGTHAIWIEVTWQEPEGAWYSRTVAYAVEILPPRETGDVLIGAYAEPLGKAGGTLTLAVPITYVRDEETYETNAGAAGGILSFEEAQAPGQFDQSVAAALEALHITLDAEQEQGSPLAPQAFSAQRTIIGGGENLGYALFEDLPISADVEPGDYSVRIEVSWLEAGDTRWQSKTLDVPVHVEAAEGIGDVMPYGENGAIVFTHAQLKAVLEGTSFNPVYLGYCDADMPPEAWETRNDGFIQYPADRAASGIAINRNVTIIGTDPRNNQRMWLLDNPKAFDAGPDTDGMHIDSGIALTLRDVWVVGSSCSGIVSSRANGASVSFINVGYGGCRVFCTTASNNSLSFTDCDIAIQSMNSSGARAQEVARLGSGGRVNLYGSNTFKREGGSVSGYDHAMFWLAGAGAFTVQEGAYARVEANNYLLREQSGATVVINGVMDLTTNGSGGCVTYGGDTLVSCTVNGALNITHNNTANPSLRVHTLNVSGTLRITKQHGVSPCIMLASGGRATFSSPQRVTLINTGGFIMRAQEGSASVSITTQAMNLENFTGKYKWNNNDLRTFTVANSLTNTGSRYVNVTGLESNRGVALGAQQLNHNTCNYGNAQILSFGQYSAMIDADTVYYGSDRIRGHAPDGSGQVIEEYAMQNGVLGSRIQSVAASGGARFQTGDDWRAVSTASSRVYLLSTLDSLEVHTYRDCADACLLRDVPAELDFGTITIAGEPQWIGRQAPDWAIRVVDTRRSGSWTLKANASPLTAADGSDTLTDALVFVKPDGTRTPLSPAAAVVIAEKGANDGQGMVEIAWPQDEGLIIYLDTYEGTPDTSYSATITWTLEIE